MINGEAMLPILLDRKRKIFDGRHRLVAANYLGIKRVPVVRTVFG